MGEITSGHHKRQLTHLLGMKGSHRGSQLPGIRDQACPNGGGFWPLLTGQMPEILLEIVRPSQTGVQEQRMETLEELRMPVTPEYHGK